MSSYLAAGGYGAAVETARKGGREVIRLLRDAELRSLDGAGTPLYIPWRACQNAPADHKYVICVADDPDPEFPIYKELLTRSPHLVIEGMICGAMAVGSTEAFLYLREENYALVDKLRLAAQEALAEGMLGEDALLEVHIITGERSFFVWEAEHQLAYLEEIIEPGGHRGPGAVQGPVRLAHHPAKPPRHGPMCPWCWEKARTGTGALAGAFPAPSFWTSAAR